MSETEKLYRSEVETQPSFHEAMMSEYLNEVNSLTIAELEALRSAELDTLGDTENRVHMLNRLIEAKGNDRLFE